MQICTRLVASYPMIRSALVWSPIEILSNLNKRAPSCRVQDKFNFEYFSLYTTAAKAQGWQKLLQCACSVKYAIFTCRYLISEISYHLTHIYICHKLIVRCVLFTHCAYWDSVDGSLAGVFL